MSVVVEFNLQLLKVRCSSGTKCKTEYGNVPKWREALLLMIIINRSTLHWLVEKHDMEMREAMKKEKSIANLQRRIW